MNKITIIPPDAYVRIDGVQHLGADMSAAPAGVRAMHWNGTRGVVETEAGEQHINTLQDWVPVLRAISAPPPPPPKDADPPKSRSAPIASQPSTPTSTPPPRRWATTTSAPPSPTPTSRLPPGSRPKDRPFGLGDRSCGRTATWCSTTCRPAAAPSPARPT